MSRSASANSAGDASGRERCAGLMRYRVAGLAVVAAVVVAAGFIGLQVRPLRAGNDDRTGSVVPIASTPLASCSAAASRRKVGELREAIARLADSVLRRIDDFERLQGEAADHEKALREVQKGYDNARSACERAAIAAIEYEQETARRDEAKASGEVFEARQNFERAQQNVQAQNDRLAQIKKSSQDAIAGLAASMLIKQRLRVAESRESEAARMLDEAESSRRELLEKTRPARVKDLRATVEKLKSNELALKTRRDLEQSKLERVRKAALEQAPSEAEKHVLALLDQGFSIEERIGASLALVAKKGDPSSQLEAEIDDLTNQLKAVVAQAALRGGGNRQCPVETENSCGGNSLPGRDRERLCAAALPDREE